jgi:hypothetical protein
VYLSTNQFADLPGVVSNASSVSIAGNLLYSGSGTLSSVGLYARQNLNGCTVQGPYMMCSGDESANKLQDITFEKGVPKAIVIGGTALNKAVQSKSGYLGFQINTGISLQGDALAITDAKATVRF